MPAEPEREFRTLVCPSDMFNDSKDLLTFIQLPGYTRSFIQLELTDEEQRLIETCIMLDPLQAAVINGTGGIRAFEFSTPQINPGSLHLTAFYAYFPEVGKVALIDLFQTDDVGPIDDESRAKLKELFEEIQEVGPERWEG